MKLNLKGMSGVVATALLLVVAVVATISFQNFYTNYQSGTFVKAEKKVEVVQQELKLWLEMIYILKILKQKIY